MAMYLEPEYHLIEEVLQQFIEEHELDKITVNSLIRGSVEVLEPDLPSASIVVLDQTDFSSAKSTKIRNIKLNLKFALNSIFSFKSICNAEDVWLVLSILKALVFLWGETQITLKEEEAIVLFCIYRLRKASVEEILNYYNSNVKINFSEIILNEKSVEEALCQLQKIGTIDVDEGKYFLKEVIYVKKTS